MNKVKDFFLTNGYLWLKSSFLESEFGFNPKTISNRAKEFENGITSNYRSISYKKGKRIEYFIRYDTIPKQQIANYKIPESDKLIDKYNIESLDNTGIDISEYNSHFLNARLKIAFYSYYFQYERFFNDLPFDEAIINAKTSAVLAELKDMWSNGVNSNKLLCALKTFPELNSLNISLSQNDKTIIRKISQFDIKAPHLTLIHQGSFNDNASKILMKDRELIFSLYRDNRKYSIKRIAEMYNDYRKERGDDPISYGAVYSTIVNKRDSSFNQMIRYGKTFFNGKLPRLKIMEKAAGYCWQLDGARIPFPVQSTKKGVKYSFYNLYIVIDAYSLCILGYSIQKHENFNSIQDSIKMATTKHGYIPKTILLDNHKGAVSSKAKDLQRKMNIYGCTWLHSKIHQPQEKGKVERIHSQLDNYFKLFDDYIGSTIQFRSRESAPNPENRRKILSRKNHITLSELRIRVHDQIVRYNASRDRDGVSRTKAHTDSINELDNQGVNKLNDIEKAFLLYDETDVMLSKDLVCFRYNGIERRYTFDKKHLLSHLNGKIRIRYNPDKLNKVYVFDTNDKFLCVSRLLKMPYRDIDDNDTNQKKSIRAFSSYQRLLKNERRKRLDGDASNSTKKEVIEKFLEKKGVKKKITTPEITMKNGRLITKS